MTLSLDGAEPQPAGTVVDQNSLTLALVPGTYAWAVTAAPQGLWDGTSARHCGSMWDLGSFTVE